MPTSNTERGKLWVVATPLGNLQDLSERAVSALRGVESVLCEDTRRTRVLLTALEIRTPTERFDAHASGGMVARVVERLLAGAQLALVTDAGTPAISDPGAVLVQAARDAKVEVVPVPGPSAVTTVLSVCGFGEGSFSFRGYFPRKDREREDEVELCRRSPVSRVFVWFESPERVVAAASVLARVASDADLFVAKEMTKVHERFFRGNAVDVHTELAGLEESALRGEWVVVARFAAPIPASDEGDLPWAKALECLVSSGVPASEAAKQVSQVFGAPKNSAYRLALRLSGKK